MKILLLDAPYDRLQNFKTSPNYPLGLSYLASHLNNNGHRTLYLNLDWDTTLPCSNPFSRKMIMSNYNNYLNELSSDSKHIVWSEFISIIEDFNPDIIGISTCSVKIKSAFKLTEIVKNINKRIITVFGGHHSQIFAREILQNRKDVDIIILGEGETTFLELANELGNSSHPRLDKITGIAYKNVLNKVIVNKKRGLIKELDILPNPSPCYYYSQKRYIKIPLIAAMASRGCPYNCNYCATNNIWERKVRRHSPQYMASLVKSIIAHQKERFLNFYDDCFTLDKKWLIEFCDILIKDKVNINWQCITSFNLLDEKILKYIVEAGCVKINIGIESGSERIIKFCNKNIDFKAVKETFVLAKKYRLSTTAYIMMGFPTETEQDIKMTQNIIKETNPNWIYCNVLIPLPGTYIYDWCVTNNLINPEKTWAGDTINSTIINYTTMSDDKFFKLVDETFLLCYKINSSITNLLKRAPIKQYFYRPGTFLKDLVRGLKYIRKRTK